MEHATQTKVNWKEYGEDRKNRFCNLNLLKHIRLTDAGMPMLKPYEGDIPHKYIAFNHCLSTRDYNQCVHFYVDDYQFERVWKEPNRYLDILKRFNCVISPDFSVFLDAPLSVNIWNIYRNKLLASYMQKCGVDIIPNIPIVPDELHDALLDGYPKGGVIAINNACSNRRDLRRHWFASVRKIIEKLSPREIIIYGNMLTLSSHKNVVYVENENLKRLRICTKKEET